MKQTTPKVIVARYESAPIFEIKNTASLDDSRLRRTLSMLAGALAVPVIGLVMLEPNSLFTAVVGSGLGMLSLLCFASSRTLPQPVSDMIHFRFPRTDIIERNQTIPYDTELVISKPIKE